MEVIKKTVGRIMTTTGITEISNVPDLDAIYYFNLNLNAEVHDWGFFDAYVVKEDLTDSLSGAYTETEFDFTEETPEIIVPTDETPETTPINVKTSITWTRVYRLAPDELVGVEEPTAAFTADKNLVVSNGGTAIREYGILYTQDNVLGNYVDLRLRISANILKSSKYGFIAPNTLYASTGTNLDVYEWTWYRAFVVNTSGDVGYGSVVSIPPLEQSPATTIPTGVSDTGIADEQEDRLLHADDLEA